MIGDVYVNDGIEIYYEYLNECIKTYNKLITISCLKNPLELKKCYFNIIQVLNKLIPWDYINNKLFLAINDGILCYKDLFENLEADMTKILDDNYDLIDNIRSIRNGIEHAPHQIEIYEISSGCNISYVEFIRIKNNSLKKYSLKSSELKILLGALCRVYNVILKIILQNQEKFFHSKDSYTLKYLKNFIFEEIR